MGCYNSYNQKKIILLRQKINLTQDYCFPCHLCCLLNSQFSAFNSSFGNLPRGQLTCALPCLPTCPSPKFWLGSGLHVVPGCPWQPPASALGATPAWIWVRPSQAGPVSWLPDWFISLSLLFPQNVLRFSSWQLCSLQSWWKQQNEKEPHGPHNSKRCRETFGFS